jgi:hypothetical protein
MRIGKTIIYVLFIGMAFMAGCSETSRIDSDDILDIEVKTVPSKKIKILWYEVYKQDNAFVVSGVLQQYGIANYGTKTSLNITVYSPAGKVLHEKDITGIHVPRRVVGDGIKWRKFKAHFPGEPSDDSKITITVK